MKKMAYRGDGVARPDAINDLDCPFCESWFPTFGILAAHVTKFHAPPTKESKRMAKKTSAPRAKRANATPARSTRTAGAKPPRADRNGSDAMNAFLKADHIGRGNIGDKGIVTLTGKVRVNDSDFGEQMICEARVNGHVYDWGIKLNSVNHRLLEDRLGKAFDNTAKWKGTKIPVVVKENMGKHYIAIEREK